MFKVIKEWWDGFWLMFIILILSFLIPKTIEDLEEAQKRLLSEIENDINDWLDGKG